MARKKRQAVLSDKVEEEEENWKDESGLTAKRRAFVEYFTNGKTAGNARQSARAAGYSKKTGDSIACSLIQQPVVQAAIDAKLRAEMSGKLTVSAVRLIDTVIKDDNAPLKIRTDCACKVIEFSGLAERIRIEKANETGLNAPSDGPKRLGEMSRDELESVVRNGAALLQAAAALPPAPVTLDASKPGESIPDKRKSLMVSVA